MTTMNPTERKRARGNVLCGSSTSPANVDALSKPERFQYTVVKPLLQSRVAGARERWDERLPERLRSPAVQPGSHGNVVLSLTVPDPSTYTFGRDVNLLWKHGILAEKLPTGDGAGRRIDAPQIATDVAPPRWPLHEGHADRGS